MNPIQVSETRVRPTFAPRALQGRAGAQARSGGVATVVLDSAGCIASATGLGSCLVGVPEEEMVGKSWVEICANEDRARLAREAFGGGSGRMVVRLRSVGVAGISPRMIEVRYAPMENGGWKWGLRWVSGEMFPPLPTEDLRALLGHCRHALLGHVAAASVCAEALSERLSSGAGSPPGDPCARILHNLSLLAEALDDCAHVAESLLGCPSQQQVADELFELLAEFPAATSRSSVSSSGKEGTLAPGAGGSPAGRRGPLRRLVRRLVHLCERYAPDFGECKLEASLEGPFFRVRVSASGLQIPRPVADMLNDPLILHGTNRRESSHCFDAFLIGMLSREIGAKVEVVECPVLDESLVILVLDAPPTDMP